LPATITSRKAGEIEDLRAESAVVLERVQTQDDVSH
jgi:hypothetical protein